MYQAQRGAEPPIDWRREDITEGGEFRRRFGVERKRYMEEERSIKKWFIREREKFIDRRNVVDENKAFDDAFFGDSDDIDYSVDYPDNSWFTDYQNYSLFIEYLNGPYTMLCAVPVPGRYKYEDDPTGFDIEQILRTPKTSENGRPLCPRCDSEMQQSLMIID